MPVWGLLRHLFGQPGTSAVETNSSPVADSSPSVSPQAEFWEVVSEPDSAEGQTAGVPETSVEPAAAPAAEPWWLHPAPQVLPLRITLAVHRLRAERELSGIERIELAFARGQQALSILQGELYNFVGQRCALRNRCYVVIRSATVEEPFFTLSLARHQEAVRTEPDGSIGRLSVSHGFPSQLEAEAFCFGAGLAGLPRFL